MYVRQIPKQNITTFHVRPQQNANKKSNNRTMQETTYHNKPKCLCKKCRPRSDATDCNNPKYWDRYVFANSVDPDQMPQNVITLSIGTDMSLQTV